MRIGNPPPIPITTIAISGIASPTTLTTAVTATLNTGSNEDIAAVTNQREIIISNLDAVGVIYARDAAATTAGAGTRIGPLQTAVLSLNATVRLTNNSGTNVSRAINQIGA